MFTVGVLIDSVKLNMGQSVALTSDEIVGMLPVFKKREDAEREFPNVEIIKLSNVNFRK